MLRHLFVLGRDLVVPPEGLSFTLDRHLARGEQIEILRDRRRPPSDPPSPQSLAGRERRRASPLAEQLRVHGFAIFSRQEEPSRRTVAAGAVPPMPPSVAPPPMPPRPFTPPPPMPPRAPVAPEPPASAPIAGWRSPFQDAEMEPDARRPPPRDPRPEPKREPRVELRGGARPFARPALEDDGAEDFGVIQDEEEVWPAARPAPRGGRLVALVLVLLVLAVAGSFYLARQWDLAQRAETEPASTASVDRRAATGPAAAQEPATPTAPSPASTPEAATPVPASVAPARAPESAPSRQAAEAPRPSRSTPPASEPAARERVAAELPSRPSLPPRRAEEPSEPALPPMRRLPSFSGLPRVEIGRAAGADGTTFTVRLSDPAGRPLGNALVSLRQTLRDGSVRETPLEAVSPPGSYRGAVPGAVRRGEGLALRVDLGNRRVEMPVTE